MDANDWLPPGWSRSSRRMCAIVLLLVLLSAVLIAPFTMMRLVSSVPSADEETADNEASMHEVDSRRRRLLRYLTDGDIHWSSAVTAMYELHLLLPGLKFNASRWFPTSAAYLEAARHEELLMEAERGLGAPILRLMGEIPEDTSKQWLLGHYRVVDHLSPLNGRSVYCQLAASLPSLFEPRWRDPRASHPCAYVTDIHGHNLVVLFYSSDGSWTLSTEDQLQAPAPASFLFAVRLGGESNAPAPPARAAIA